MVYTRPEYLLGHQYGEHVHMQSHKRYWQVVKWTSRYILGIVDIGLKFEQDKNFGQWVGYVDSNFACDLDKCHSTTWYLFTLVRGLVR